MAGDLNEGQTLASNDYLGWAATLLWWIVYPIAIAIYYVVFYVLSAILTVIQLLWRPIEFLLLPVFFLAHFLLQCLVAPFRLIAKFETIYIYLGVAALVGVSGGLVLSSTYSALHKWLRLDPKPEPSGRTARQYREDKQKQKADAEAPLIYPGSLASGYLSLSDSSKKGRQARGLIAQTILEEEDSDL